jgi:hypothetical protein
MGLVSMGPPRELLDHLRKGLNIEVFIETGTYLGNTAIEASQIFAKVITIEASFELYQTFAAVANAHANIGCLLGDSRSELRKAIDMTNGRRLYWLDAHWSGGITFGQTNECPVLNEIAICQELDPDGVLMIDDARLFLSPPPEPHNSEAWPTIGDITAELKNNYTIVISDVIVSVPGRNRKVLETWAKERTMEIWRQYGMRRPSIASRILRRLKKKE